MAESAASHRPAAATQLPTVIDVEASGFGRESYPIEVGFVRPDGSAFCTLIRPAAEWTHWDEEAEQLHHITRAKLERHGRSVAAVADQLNHELHGRTVFTDAWAHDYVWLSALFEAAGCAPTFRIEDLRVLLNEEEARAWDRAKRQVSEETHLQRHRASADARLLQMTLQRVRASNSD